MVDMGKIGNFEYPEIKIMHACNLNDLPKKLLWGSNPTPNPNPNPTQTQTQNFARARRIFPNSLKAKRTSFCTQRRKIAEKLKNTRLEQITFHTFRHWKATTEYAKTKDILYVKKLLGHKRIEATLIYTQLVDFESDDFHVKVAETLEEACELVEAGFEFVTDMEDRKIFRKRK